MELNALLKRKKKEKISATSKEPSPRLSRLRKQSLSRKLLLLKSGTKYLRMLVTFVIRRCDTNRKRRETCSLCGKALTNLAIVQCPGLVTLPVRDNGQ